MADLIDRETLLRDIEKYHLSDGMFQHWVEVQPSVEAEPVQHGRWIPMNVSSGRDSWKCSLCGRRARGALNNLPYCHCGARMDGE